MVKKLMLCALLSAALAGSVSAQEPLWSTKSRSPGDTAIATSGDAKVIIAPEVLEGWSFMYKFITEVEFVLCLEGREENGRIIVDAFRLARMEAADANTVRYQPCTGDRYVGTAHNHPPVPGMGALCYRSAPDVVSFEKDRRAVVDIVLCGENRYVWVLRDGSHGGVPTKLAHQLAP